MTPYTLTSLRALPLAEREAAIRQADASLLNVWACQLKSNYALCVEMDADKFKNAESFVWTDVTDEQRHRPLRNPCKRTSVGKTPLVINACDSTPWAMMFAGEFLGKFEQFRVDQCGPDVTIYPLDLDRKVEVEGRDADGKLRNPNASDIVRCVILALECGA